MVIVRIGWQRVGEMAEEMKRMRAQMEEDEQVASLMRGLRGQNLSDELFASADTQLRLVEVTVNLFPCLVMWIWHYLSYLKHHANTVTKAVTNLLLVNEATLVIGHKGWSKIGLLIFLNKIKTSSWRVMNLRGNVVMVGGPLFQFSWTRFTLPI